MAIQAHPADHSNSGSMRRVILIGATSGSGRALASIFAREGWMVGITGRRQDHLDSFIAEHKGYAVHTSCFDATATDRRNRLTELIDAMGGMDLFIYAAGVGTREGDYSPDVTLQMLAVNVEGFTDLSLLAWEYFTRQGYGHIAGVSSIAGYRGMLRAPAYSGSKSYMHRFLEGLWHLARRNYPNIRVTDLQPGFLANRHVGSKPAWMVVPIEKAAEQMFRAIMAGRRKAYISRRYMLLAAALRIAPTWLLSRLT